jgi:hypothetical protein
MNSLSQILCELCSFKWTVPALSKSTARNSSFGHGVARDGLRKCREDLTAHAMKSSDEQ